MMKQIGKLFLQWRLWLFIPLCIGVLFVPPRGDSVFTTLLEYSAPTGVLASEFVYPWANFDGVHYVAIASRGYQDEGRFLPLFPATLRSLVVPLGFSATPEPYGSLTFWIAILLSTLFGFLTVVMFVNILALDYKEQTVRRAVLFLVLFPTAFFLATIYTEGLFLFLSLGSLFAARKKRWFLAAFLGMLVAVTRLSGVLILIPLLIEYWKLEVTTPEKRVLSQYRSALWFLLVPVLLASYSFYNYVTWNDFLYFVHAHGQLGNSRAVSAVVFPLVTVVRYVRILLTVSPSLYEYWVALLEFASLCFAVWALYQSWKQKIRTSYFWYSVSLVAVPLLSGTLSGFPRYVLPIFPLFIATTVYLEKRPRLRYVVLGLSVLLQAALFILFTRRYFVA